MVKMTIAVLLAGFLALGILGLYALATKREDDKLLDKVQRDHLRFFEENFHPDTGLVLDRNNPTSPASIASVGFALPAFAVGVERGWIPRERAVDWTRKVLSNLLHTPQGDAVSGVSGHHGFFYHFLDPATGLRSSPPKYWHCELSSIDTALLMAGVLFAYEFYTGDSEKEKEIRSLADALLKRVEWDWMANENGVVRMAWYPETQDFGKDLWYGYSEGQLIYILGMGSPTHPLKAGAWDAHISHVQPQTHYGQTYILLPGGPLFTYQYQHCWVDFRGIFDVKARQMGFDWFENSRRATIAQHRYAKENPNGWRGYGERDWGLTACDGPGNFTKMIDGKERTFRGYSERGCPNGFDDGTIAPTAAISSMPFAPELAMPTLKHWLEDYPQIYRRHGFADSFNPTLDPSTPVGWVNTDSIGIDQGPIVLMLENYRSELIWRVMRESEYLRNGLTRAGFTGGWLSK